MMIKHLKLADGTAFIAWLVKVLVDTVPHEKVLEIARQNNYIIVHLHLLLTKSTLNRANCFLVEVVQTE